MQKGYNNQKFFFLAGCGHTGSSIIARYFGAHDEIFLIPKESGLLLANRYHLFDNLINDLIKQKSSANKKYILEKTPRHIWHFDYARKIIPNCSFFVSFRNPISTLISLKKRYNCWDLSLQRLRDDTVMGLRQLGNKDVKPILFELFSINPQKYFDHCFNSFELKSSREMLNFYKLKIDWNKIGDNIVTDEHDKLRYNQVNSALKPYSGINNYFSLEDINYAIQLIKKDTLSMNIFSDLKNILSQDNFISQNIEVDNINFLAEWNF